MLCPHGIPFSIAGRPRIPFHLWGEPNPPGLYVRIAIYVKYILLFNTSRHVYTLHLAATLLKI
jgi:hypothetical protein